MRTTIREPERSDAWVLLYFFRGGKRIRSGVPDPKKGEGYLEAWKRKKIMANFFVSAFEALINVQICVI